MRKVICYYSEENNVVAISEEPGSVQMWLTDEDKLKLTFADEPAPVAPVTAVTTKADTEMVLTLAKDGMSAEDIAKLKHAGVI